MKQFFKSTIIFFKAMPSIIAFEIFYKLIVTSIALPVVAFILQKAIDLSGVGYLTEKNFFEFLTQPFSAFLVLLVLILCSIVTIVEISAIISCFAQLRKKNKIRIFIMFKTGFLSIKKMLFKKNFMLIWYVMLIFPITQITLSSGIFASVGIPSISVLLRLDNVKVIVCFISIFLIFLPFIVSRIYCLHFFTLTEYNYSESVSKSRKITSGKILKTTCMILLWIVFITIIFMSAFFMLCFISAFIFKGFSEPETAFFMSLKTIKVLFKIFMTISSLFATPMIFAFITCNFMNEEENEKYIIIPDTDKKSKPWKIRMYAYTFLVISLIMNYTFMRNLASGDIPLRSGFFNQTKVTAHRGFSSAAPENTEPAFAQAINIGAEFIELDVQLSADGEIVVIHDSSLLRTADTDSLVKSKTYEELLELDFGKWFKKEYEGTGIMRLEEVLEKFGDDIGLNIEIKKTGDEIEVAERTAMMIEEYGLEKRCYVTSFSYNALKSVKRVNSDIKTGLIANMMTYGEYASLHYIDALSLNYRFVSQNLVNNIHMNGKKIFVWTVNDSSDMERMINMGVDHIITDNPDTAIKTISSQGIEIYVISFLSKIFNY